MLRFLAQTVLTILGNALGLIVASVLLGGFSLSFGGFVVSVLFFTLSQIILSPFIFKMAVQYVPALRGGIALVTTFVVLLLTVWLTNGVSIRGATAWVVAPFIIWVCTVLAGVLLPLVLFKKVLAKKRSEQPPAPA